MDEMKLRLSTRFMRNMASKMIARAIRKKIGCDMDIQLNDLAIDMTDDGATLKANVEVKLNNEELYKLLSLL